MIRQGLKTFWSDSEDVGEKKARFGDEEWDIIPFLIGITEEKSIRISSVVLPVPRNGPSFLLHLPITETGFQTLNAAAGSWGSGFGLFLEQRFWIPLLPGVTYSIK